MQDSQTCPIPQTCPIRSSSTQTRPIFITNASDLVGGKTYHIDVIILQQNIQQFEIWMRLFRTLAFPVGPFNGKKPVSKDTNSETFWNNFDKIISITKLKLENPKWGPVKMANIYRKTCNTNPNPNPKPVTLTHNHNPNPNRTRFGFL